MCGVWLCLHTYSRCVGFCVCVRLCLPARGCGVSLCVCGCCVCVHPVWWLLPRRSRSWAPLSGVRVCARRRGSRAPRGPGLVCRGRGDALLRAAVGKPAPSPRLAVGPRRMSGCGYQQRQDTQDATITGTRELESPGGGCFL